MVAPICATLLLAVYVASASVSEFFLNTAHGILSIHFVLVDFVVANYDIMLSLRTPNAQLLATATLLLLGYSYYFVSREDVKLSFAHSISLSIALFALDMLILLFSTEIAQELNIILFILLSSTAIAGCLMKRPTAHSLNSRGRIEMDTLDLFVDNSDVFGILGRTGRIHFFSVLLLLIIQIPALYEFRLLWYITYVARSISTLSMLFTPAFFGGFVQAMKTYGAKIATRGNGRTSSHAKPFIVKDT